MVGIATTLAMAVLGAGCGWTVYLALNQPVQPEPAVSRITEDSPGWNCHTMGNRLCGRP